MAMMQAILKKKIALTEDVLELHYDIEGIKNMLPGQFITFIIAGIGGRSYSVLEMQDSHVVLIIKRWAKEDGGRGGSIFLCDSEVGDEFKCVGPTGHFTLSSENVSRCFLGTGTGFVPLYNQSLGALERGDAEKLHFVFGVKTQKDLFYVQQLRDLSEKYSNFSYQLFLSREDSEMTQRGYVTDFLSESTISEFKEFYICGAPAMIEDSTSILSKLGVGEENVFFEKYA